jgi:hypothetical protein
MKYMKYIECGYCYHTHVIYKEGEAPAEFVQATCPGAQTPKTQKVKGLIAMVASPHLSSRALRISHLIQSIEQAEKVVIPTSGKWFARPCPETPRHGFLESRVVKSSAELIALVKETLEIDPKGEVMVLPFVDATHNLIWTPGLVSIGPGHDGATAGKDTLSIPLAGKIPKGITQTLHQAGVPAGEWPYIEAVVEKEGPPRYTQLRAGPKVEGVNPDFIPKEVKVEKILTPNTQSTTPTDLLEWETLMREAAPGTVVYHPGGSLISHYAIHARVCGVPFLTTREPKVGEILEEIPTPKVNPLSVLEGAAAASRVKLSMDNCSEAVSMILVGTHHSAAMVGDHSRWIGAAAVMMLRLGVTAIKGEARHFNQGHKPLREQVYEKVFNLSLSRQRAAVGRVVNLFRYGAWGGSVGGKRWAACAVALVPLFNTLRDLSLSPTEESVNALLLALNKALNQAHYNGWWMNKFTSTNAFTKAADGDESIAIEAALLATEMGILPTEKVSEITSRWADWPVTMITPPKVESVEMLYTEGMPGIQLRPTIRGYQKKVAPIVIPACDLAKSLKALGDIYLVTGEDRLRVECRPLSGAPITLWTEPVPGEELKK